MKYKIAILTLALLALLSGCSKKEEAPAALASGDFLEIPVNELSETIRIYPVTVDGLQMEILAARDDDGTLRTAFNTC